MHLEIFFSEGRFDMPSVHLLLYRRCLSDGQGGGRFFCLGSGRRRQGDAAGVPGCGCHDGCHDFLSDVLCRISICRTIPVIVSLQVARALAFFSASMGH